MNQRAPTRAWTGNAPVMVIDVGGTNIKFGYSLDGVPQYYRKLFPTDALRVDDPVTALGGMINDVTAETGIKPRTIVVAVPGFIDTDDDHVLYAANVMSLNGRRLGTELGQLVGTAVLLERDAVLMLTGEVLTGAARDADHVLGVFFGTGIGAAFMDDGKPFRGAGWALEIGRTPFLGEGDIPDDVRPDCLEAYASGRALQGIADRYGVAIELIFRESGSNAALAQELDRFVRYQAITVGMAVAMVSPATILLGGGVMDMDGYPREKLAEHIERLTPVVETGRSMDLRWCEHGWLAVLHGAPAVVAEHLGRSSHLLVEADL
ncbi:Sugar kinase of the NBD/HSP70 family, may contain an N-terminal HTH domain [Burkholderia sp. OK233]|nr:Sugar kinase of the NBD/HSP70 family, may contain an N-terminal HTH domain [Burkholderia sp. OK233]